MELREKVEEILDKYVRPELETHCGGIEVAEIRGDTVIVRLLGEWAGCASSYYTLDALVEKELKEHIPEIQRVEQEEINVDFYNEVKAFLKKEKEKEAAKSENK